MSKPGSLEVRSAVRSRPPGKRPAAHGHNASDNRSAWRGRGNKRAAGRGRPKPAPARAQRRPEQSVASVRLGPFFSMVLVDASRCHVSPYPSSALSVRSQPKIRPTKSDSAERDGRQRFATLRFFVRTEKPRPAGGGPGGVAPVGSRPALCSYLDDLLDAGERDGVQVAYVAVPASRGCDHEFPPGIESDNTRERIGSAGFLGERRGSPFAEPLRVAPVHYRRLPDVLPCLCLCHTLALISRVSGQISTDAAPRLVGR